MCDRALPRPWTVPRRLAALLVVAAVSGDPPGQLPLQCFEPRVARQLPVHQHGVGHGALRARRRLRYRLSVIPAHLHRPRPERGVRRAQTAPSGARGLLRLAVSTLKPLTRTPDNLSELVSIKYYSFLIIFPSQDILTLFVQHTLPQCPTRPLCISYTHSL